MGKKNNMETLHLKIKPEDLSDWKTYTKSLIAQKEEYPEKYHKSANNILRHASIGLTEVVETMGVWDYNDTSSNYYQLITLLVPEKPLAAPKPVIKRAESFYFDYSLELNEENLEAWVTYAWKLRNELQFTDINKESVKNQINRVVSFVSSKITKIVTGSSKDKTETIQPHIAVLSILIP